MDGSTLTIAVLTDEYLEYRKLIVDQIVAVLSGKGYGTLCIAGRELNSEEQCVLCPVYAGENLFGYFLIDPEGLDLLYLDSAAQSIGNALRNQHLIASLEQQSYNLELSNLELEKLANFDELTGLANRLKFKNDLTNHCQKLKNRETEFVLLFIDLDGFKQVNDTLGHRAGDQLLRLVSMRLKETTDIYENYQCVISRLGGDEFTVAITPMDDRHRIEHVISALIESLSKPYPIKNDTANISASIGIAQFPDHGEDIESLIKHADIAMYGVKNCGKNCWHWYAPEPRAASDTTTITDQTLQQALSRGGIYIHFQPRVNIKTRKLVAVEAIMRWHINAPGSTKTRASPTEFKRISETSGLTTQLEAFTLDASCRQAKNGKLPEYQCL